jgi:hypothetical protein
LGEPLRDPLDPVRVGVGDSRVRLEFSWGQRSDRFREKRLGFPK